MVEQVIVAAGGRSLFHLLRAYREAQEASTCGTSSVTHTRSRRLRRVLKPASAPLQVLLFPSRLHSSALSAEPRTCGR